MQPLAKIFCAFRPSLGCARALIFGLMLLSSGAAHAQDWSVQSGDERRQEIVRRYQQMLEKSPVEGLIFNKIIENVGRGKGLDALIREYQKKVADRPEALNYRLILGHLHKAKNEVEAALEQYDKAVELGPEDPNTWLSRGSARVLLGQQKEATADFDRALELERNKDKKRDILRKLADAAFAQHDWARAETYYDQLIALSPRDEYLRMEYAQVLMKYKQYDKALGQYDALLNLVGRDAKKRATTLRDKGDVYEKMGRPEAAVDEYRKAMTLMLPSNWLYQDLQYRVINAYRSMDRLGDLAAEFSKKWPTPNFDQTMMLAELYDELGDEERALTFFQRASSQKRNDTGPRLKIISILKRRGDDARVIDAYQALIAVAANQSRYYFDLVQLYFRIGKRDEAEKLLGRIASRFANDATVYQQLADTYMRFDMREPARKAYERLLRMDAKNPSYIMSLGEFYYRHGELDEARKTWQKLLSARLSKSEAYAMLGNIYAEYGMMDQGITYFQRAIELAPDDMELRQGLAQNFVRARRWEQAVDAWDYVIEHADSAELRAQARGQIIKIQEQRGFLAQEMQEWRAAFEAEEPAIEAGYFLAEAHLYRKEYREAEAAYQALIDLDQVRDEADLEALTSLLRIYQRNGEPEKAIGVLEDLAGIRPQLAPDYYHQIADLALKLFQDDKALDYARRAVEQNPDDARAHAHLAGVYEQMQHFQSAIDEYQQAVDLDPRSFGYAMKLAELFMATQDYPRAEKLYRRIVQRAEDEALILDAGRAAIKLAHAEDRLGELELEFSPLVFQSRSKSAHRKLMLEIYEQMIGPLAKQHEYNLAGAERSAAALQTQARLDELARASYPVLMDALLSDDISQRALAIRLLGDLKAGAAATSLARIAVDATNALRGPAAVALVRIGDERAAGTLAAALDHDDPRVRELAAWALGYSSGPVATSALAKVLDSGQNEVQKTLAAFGLGRTGGKNASAALLKAAQRVKPGESGAQLDAALFWALGRARVEAAVPTLADALSTAPADLASVAAWSLAQVGNDAAFAALLTSYWGASAQRRAVAAIGLAQFAGASPAHGRASNPADPFPDPTQFVDIIRHELDVPAMMNAMRQHAQFIRPERSEDIIAAHVKAFQSAAVATLGAQDLAARRVVLQDLVDMTNGGAAGILAPVSDADRQAVSQVLHSLQPQLLQVAATSEPEVLRPLAHLLASGGDAASGARLVELAENADRSVRAAALSALGAWATNSVHRAAQSVAVMPLLTSSLGDEAFAARAAAASSLGAWAQAHAEHRAQAIQLLTSSLGDESSLVRQAAAQGLASIGSDDAISTLSARLSALSATEQIAALRALAGLGSAAAMEIVESYRDNPDIRVREAVRRLTSTGT